MASPFNTWVHVEDDDLVLPAAVNDYQFSAALPGDWEFTRAGAALGRGPDGRWASYPANTLRPHHDPVTKVNLGALVEPSRTQLITTPRPLVATAVQSAFTVDTTTQTPFGLGGRLVIPNTTSAFHGFDLFFGGTNRASAIPDGAVVSIMMVFKPLGTFSRGVLLPQLRTGAYQSVEFTTSDGGAILSSTVLKASISPDTDGFFRLEATIAYGTGTTGGSANFSFRTPEGVRGFAGDGVSGILVAYFGAEIGSECTSPILPANGVTSRSEDDLRTSATWLVPGPKAFALQYTPLSSDNQVILGTDGADGMELSTSGQSVFYTTTTPAGSVGPLTGTAPAAGTERTSVFTAMFNYFLLVQDGKLLAYSETGIVPSEITGIRLGARAGGGLGGPVLIKRLKFWKREMERDVLSAFSADISIPGIAPVLPVIDIQASRSIPAGDTSIAMTVTLTGGPTGARVNYRTVDGTAIAGVDYTAATGTVVFPLGENSASISILLGTRSLLEQRSFTIELFSPVDAVLGTAHCQVILIKAAPTAHAPLKVATFDGPLSGDWSLTRSTPGYSRNASGVWTEVPANQPRIHYSGPGDVGILIEPATTQCLFESLNFGYLLNSTQTITTTAQTPVSMRTKVWRETAITGNHLLRGFWANTAATWPTGDFIFWCILKPVGRTRYRMAVKGIDNIFRGAVFELSGEGSVILTTAADVIATVEPEPYWPGVYRIGIANPQATNAGVAAEFDIGPVDPANNNSTTTVGNTAFGLDLYHFQVEPGLFWTSPIPVVTAAAVTSRSADVLKAAGTWYRRESFALGAQFTRLGSTPASQRIVQFRDIAPAVDDFGILIASGVTRAPLTTGAVFQGQIDGAANVVKAPSTAVVSIDTTRYAMWVGGTKAGELSMAGKDMPRQVEHLRFGSKEQDGSQGAPIVLKKIAYWTVGLTDEEGTVFSGDLSGVPPGEVEPEPLPLINIPATLSAPEGQSISIPVTKIGNGACSVNFRTKGQTATVTAPADYVGIGDPNPAAPAARIVTFAANESTKLVTFQSLADAVDEPENEKLGIEISVFNNPPDCQIGQGVGVITIVEAVKPPDSSTIYARSKTFASVNTDAGIGRTVYRVTNLRDDNSVGSLRYGINLGARHIIFEVGGVIQMTGDWSFTKNDVTISGETAPYPGITIRGSETAGGTIKPGASKRVHFSHINFERCVDKRTQSNTNSDCIDLAPAANTVAEDIEFRHCSFFWSNDEMISVWTGGKTDARGIARRISFTDCMFCEPIWRAELTPGYPPHMENNNPDPPSGVHNYGIILGVNSLNVDFQYSMLTDAAMRGPFVDTGTSVLVANMIALNSNKGLHITMNNYDPPYRAIKVTCVGYLCISGPNTTATDFAGIKVHPGYVKEIPAGSVIWVDGMYSRKGGTSAVTPLAPTWNTVQTENTAQKAFFVNPATTARPVDIPGNPVPKLSAADIRARAIKNIGPRPKDRIPNITRKIRHLEGDTGAFVSHQKDVGGPTNIAQTTRALNGSTPFSSTDSTIIPAYPTVSGNATAADKTAVRNWLEFFLTRLQYD